MSRKGDSYQGVEGISVEEHTDIDCQWKKHYNKSQNQDSESEFLLMNQVRNFGSQIQIKRLF